MKRFILFLLILIANLVNSEETESQDIEEGRGKAKYALLMHFFYVVATKLFVLKIVYGVIFYVILTKAWHFVIWFIHYLKEKKSHENYVEFDHYDHHDHHGYYDHQPYSGYEYINPTYGLGDNYSKFKKHGVYDADGSYSVKKT
ncbi:unnamed protein product [Parnassius apollo]|uniref:(apollo) hypothetical protein n=1 Tax=Parnassius apollo TaxID=110799 RepID=A0A8S3WGM6_PARAO|nr:unnamed protein product [Parnassius apollo]